MHRGSWTFFVGLIGVGCAAAPPPKVDPPEDPAPSAPAPKSAEWLYATEGVSGGHRAECRAIPERLESETRCKRALCSHGAALAKDWLATCKGSAADLVSRVEQQSTELSKRASQSPAPCEAEISDVLRDGCAERKDCKELVQGWATRCADYGTPLVLRMLEVAVERQSGEHVSVDGRSCSELFEPVMKAQSCDHKFKCQDVLSALETYRGRCEPKGKPVAFTAAVVEASLLAGADQKVPAIGLSSDGATLDTKTVPLSLDDGSGAALLVCGKRAPDLAAYLGARASCNEDVTFARRFADPSGAVLRVGRVPHSDDASFRRRFPSLMLRGEAAARYDAELPAFERDVDAAIALAQDAKQSRDAIRGFLTAVLRHLDAVRNSKAFDGAIRGRDAALVPLFQAIGRAKKKAMHPEVAKLKLGGALHRAEELVLADVAGDGKVRIGELTVAGSLELGKMLPKSMAAYREELASRFARLPKLDDSNNKLEKLRAEASTKVDRCGKAMKGAAVAEQALLACYFGEKDCDDARKASLSSDLDAARQDAEAQYLATALAVASLPESQREELDSRADDAGCTEP